MTKRRTFLKTAGAAGTVGLLAGCTGGDGGDGGGDGGDGGGDGGDGGDGEATDTATATSTSTPEPYNNGTVNFIMSPSEAQDLMMDQYAPVRDHLAEATGVETKLKYASSYSAVIQSLGNAQGDMAEMGPLAAALGVQTDALDIVLQRKGFGSYTYTSVIVTREGSGIESLTDLEGKKIGFADRLSASGMLFPLYMLQQAGLDIGNLPIGDGSSADFSARIASHAAAFEALANGQVDAAGVGQFIALNDDRELKDGYAYVSKESGIPRAPICTSTTLSDEESGALVDAFVNAPDSVYYGKDGEEGTDDDLWFSAVREADLETYSKVMDAAESVGIKEELLQKSA